MKKLTLAKTWSECLKMWKWVAAQSNKTRKDVGALKRKWLKVHSSMCPSANCFFCEYVEQGGSTDCKGCPGKLVSKRFSCMNKTYDYERRPKAFYKKLVELNKKRKEKK